MANKCEWESRGRDYHYITNQPRKAPIRIWLQKDKTSWKVNVWRAETSSCPGSRWKTTHRFRLEELEEAKRYAEVLVKLGEDTGP